MDSSPSRAWLRPVLAILIAVFPPLGATAVQASGRVFQLPSAAAAPRSASAESVVTARLTEENLPPEEMPSPTPAAPSPSAPGGPSPSAAGSPSPFNGGIPLPSPSSAVSPESGSTGHWVRLRPSESSPTAPVPEAPPTAAATVPTEEVGPSPTGESPAEVNATPESGSAAEAQAQPSPTEVPPALDIGSVTLAPPVSDSPLASLIQTAPSPARAASLRVTDEAREDITNRQADDAIRILARAVSIDPSNSYAYFYLGRAYLLKANLPQALIFFKRAEIGFGSDPAWLGETLGFEGACYEEQGRVSDAVAAYKRALDAAPNNLMARTGYGRLGVSAEGSPGAVPPPPEGSVVTPPPQEAPPPPAYPTEPTPEGMPN